jgi:hypothetical protein
MTKQYSHRNGETEPPTQRGWYWVWVTAPYPVWPGVLMRFVELYEGADYKPDAWGVDIICNQSLESIGDTLRWWGPVTPPWDDAL